VAMESILKYSLVYLLLFVVLNLSICLYLYFTNRLQENYKKIINIIIALFISLAIVISYILITS